MATTFLPDFYSDQTLYENMQALHAVKPILASRIALPVGNEHIKFHAGRMYYLHNRTWISLNEPSAREHMRPLDDKNQNALIVFGIGDGEILAELEKLNAADNLHVWDRDPWLIRLFLMRYPLADRIRTGKVRISLAVDLLDLAALTEKSQIIEHPVLCQIYSNERDLLRAGVGSRRAMICPGGLFFRSISKALAKSGFTLFTLDVKNIAIEEIAYAIRRFRPEFIFSINYINGLESIAEGHNVKWICWEIDPSYEKLRAAANSTRNVHVFTYRRRNVAEYSHAGFENVRPMLLATDPELRKPASLKKEDLEQYRAGVSFVGSSMVAESRQMQRLFVEAYKTYRPHATDDREALHILETILGEQETDMSRFRIPELLEKRVPGFDAFLRANSYPFDMAMIIGEIAAAKKRAKYLNALASFSLRVWGDEGWVRVLDPRANYMGPARHGQELNKVYSASAINLDINRIYQPDIITMRIFDILACGGFVLAEANREIADVLTPGEEIELYTGPEELLSKVNYFLAHPERARQIARAGRQRVLAEHTINHRLPAMLAESGLAEGPTG